MKWLKHHISDTILTRLLTAACKMGIVILTARFFGADGRGLIGILAYSMTLLMLLSEFVGGSSLITLVPTIRLKNLLYPSYLWATIICVGGYLLLPLFPEVPEYLYIHIFGLSLLLAYITINYSILIGKTLLKWQNWSALSIAILTLVFLAVSVVLLGEKRIELYIYGLYIGEGFAFILSSAVLITKFKEELKGPLEWKKELFQLGFVSQLGHLIQFFNYRLSYVFILWYLTQEHLGIYSTVFVLTELIWIFGNSIGTVLHMKIVNREEGVDLRALTMKYTKLSSLLTLGLVFVVAVIPSLFWEWLLGEEFGAIQSIFWWLIPGVMALGFSTCISHYFHALKKFKVLIWSNGFGLIVKVLALLYYSQGLNLNNVALASSFGLIAIAVFLVVVYLKEPINKEV